MPMKQYWETAFIKCCFGIDDFNLMPVNPARMVTSSRHKYFPSKRCGNLIDRFLQPTFIISQRIGKVRRRRTILRVNRFQRRYRMPKINRIRKQIRKSQWFTDRIRLPKSPLDRLSETRGLINPSTFCFINSGLQCLIHCEPFAQVMLYGEHESTGKGFCALCALKRLTCEILREKKEASTALAFAMNSPILNPEFTMGTQQDAHEFLKCLITKMAVEENYGCGTAHAGIQQCSHDRPVSLIRKVFSFKTKTKITCSKCDTKTEKEEECNDLCLQITTPNNDEIESVGEALSYYFGTEELHGENSYMCEKCDERVKATKQVSLQTGPNVLVICLVRFLIEYDIDLQDLMAKKLDHHVRFSRKLDVTPYMHEMGTKDELKLGAHQYRLSGFIYHVGEHTNGGHYISNVFLPGIREVDTIGQWFEKNDDYVVPVDFNRDANAYLLFYTREDSQSPDLPGPKKKKESVKNKKPRKRRGRKKRKWREELQEEDMLAMEVQETENNSEEQNSLLNVDQRWKEWDGDTELVQSEGNEELSNGVYDFGDDYAHNDEESASDLGCNR